MHDPSGILGGIRNAIFIHRISLLVIAVNFGGLLARGRDCSSGSARTIISNVDETTEATWGDVIAMAFDAIALAANLDELRALVGNRIARIHTTNRSGELLLFTHGRGGSAEILLSIRREDARIQRTFRKFTHPDHPGAFVMNLRKHILRARIEGFEQIGLDRMCRISLSARDALGHEYPLVLMVETMGRNSNVILVHPGDEDKILTAMRFVSADRNAHRSVLPGHPYRLPPARNTISPAEVTQRGLLEGRDDETPAWLHIVRRIDGPGPQGLRRILAHIGCDPNDPLPADSRVLDPLVQHLQQLGENLEKGRWQPWICTVNPEQPLRIPAPECYGLLVEECPPSHAHCRSTSRPSAAMDAYFALVDAITGIRSRRARLQRTLTDALKAARKKRKKQMEDLSRADSAEEKRVQGELLTAYMHQVPTGARKVEVPDYYAGGTPREITLDPRRTPSENAARFFHQYRRLQRTEKKAKRQVRATEREIRYIQDLLYELDLAGSLPALDALEAEVAAAGYGKEQAPPRRRKQPSPEPLRQALPSGHEVLVGKNSRGNDHLTMRLASDHDLWFHVKDLPGSHVILPGPWDEALPPPHILQEAAEVAAQHSAARDSSNVAVDFTLVKHVTKPKGARPGMVIYRNEKTLFVTPTS